MAFTGPLEDRQLIRELLDTYSDTSTRMDMDAWLGCWTEDCVWIIPWAEHRGKDALRKQTEEIWAALDTFVFITQVGAIEVDGDTAYTRCVCQELLQLKGDRTVKPLVGGYEDRLVRQDGQWRFAERRYRLVMGEPLG